MSGFVIQSHGRLQERVAGHGRMRGDILCSAERHLHPPEQEIQDG